ncbi:hypothetical protein GCM10010919_04820 [Alishewanella longhuensis]|uniref:STAS domain-containing protein n=1 Tax=Alishewanella longhuensis TaxID=1091037 RepID=A0ABQ3KTZ6_9ALTE|nr:STAS domain-containing protein [Alishewanella longhuensis]GHG60917.1 hypothetical protein GCM10010919_04820 [Alishewanella longhuensis]
MTIPHQIFFACVEQSCYIKLCGELRYTHATGMDDLLARLVSKEIACDRLVIDLNQASFIDSTHIGMLASLARFCQQQQLPKPTLFSTQAEVNTLLYGLCLDQAFDIIEQPTMQQFSMDPVAEKNYSEQQQGLMILRAHQALVALNDKNKSAFQPVVDLLKQQLGE